jgi:hypothetical protein
MSVRQARWVLWLAAFCMLPLPFFLVETGFAPLLRMALLAGINVAVIVTEGSSGAVGIASAIIVAELLAYAFALWVVSGWLVRAFEGLSRRVVAAVVLTIIAAAVAVTTTHDVYRTPFRPDAPRSNLLHLLD